MKQISPLQVERKPSGKLLFKDYKLNTCVSCDCYSILHNLFVSFSSSVSCSSLEHPKLFTWASHPKAIGLHISGVNNAILSFYVKQYLHHVLYKSPSSPITLSFINSFHSFNLPYKFAEPTTISPLQKRNNPG